MANKGFSSAVETILKHEGGYVNHPKDRGGPTNWGITQKTYEQYKKRPVTLAEIQKMPRSEAIDIYKKNYWDTVGGDNLKYYSVALALFDQAVNRGPSTVLKQAQRIVRLTPSGTPTPQTINAINAMSDTTFLDNLFRSSQESYKAIVAKDPSQEVFLQGWLNRVDKLRKETSQYLGQLNVKAIGIGVASLALIGAASYLFFVLWKHRK